MTLSDRRLEVVRVVVLSPGDVAEERDTVALVIDELNRRVARAHGCLLSLWRWEIDARSGMHIGGPQGLIDERMQIGDADIAIGVFWKRFGTPTGDAQSGTEHELRRAWDAWRSNKRPDVMVYFCAQDILAWTRQLCLADHARGWELKRLRYRLLHQSARISCHARRRRLRLGKDWPWAGQLAAAFARLQALPAATG